MLRLFASIFAVLVAAGLGAVVPAAVEQGLILGPVALVGGFMLLCLLAWGLSMISQPSED